MKKLSVFALFCLLLASQLSYASDSVGNVTKSRMVFTIGLMITAAGIGITTNGLHELVVNPAGDNATTKEIFDGMAVALVGGMCMTHSFELAMLRREEVTPFGCYRGSENV